MTEGTKHTHIAEDGTKITYNEPSASTILLMAKGIIKMGIK